MRKIVYTFLSVATLAVFGFAGTVLADPYVASYQFGMTASDSSTSVQDIVAPSFDGKCYMFGVDPTTHLPSLMQGPTGLTCDSGVIGLTMPESGVSSLSSDLSNLTSNLAGTNSLAQSAYNNGDGFGSAITVLQHNAQNNNSTTSITYTTPSIVTSTGAVGTQISTTQSNGLHFSGNVTTTASIGGPQEGALVLEVAKTNSATASDWKEQARCTNSQTITLALVLNSVQKVGCQLNGFLPQGNYYKVRSISTSGTPSFGIDSGWTQAVQYGY